MIANFLLRLLDPFRKICLGYRLDGNRHESVIDAAELVVLAIVDAWFLDLCPGLVDPSRGCVFLDPERGHEKAVNDVGTGHEQPDGGVDWHNGPLSTSRRRICPDFSSSSGIMLLSKLSSP